LWKFGWERLGSSLSSVVRQAITLWGSCAQNDNVLMMRTFVGSSQ
jgi:hypothetical protein